MEVSTETKTPALDLEPGQPSNLAAPTQGGTVITAWKPPTWDEARRALAKKSVCPPNTTEDEFDFFIAWCIRTGLDPFIQQAYLVPRRMKDAAGNWVDKMQPQAAVAGMAARADALPDFRGMRSGVVYPGDEFMVDENSEDPKAAVIHRWSLEARVKAGGKDWKQKPLGAWAHAQRVGRAVPVTYLTIEERKPLKADGTPLPSPFWSIDKAPAQLRKCCEAEQYRKAYPNIFGGVYIEGEMEHAQEREVNPAPSPVRSPTSKSDALKAKLGVKPVDPPKTVEAAAAPNPDAKSKTPPIDCLRFGPLKGTLIADVSTLELQEAVAIAQKNLAEADPKTSKAWAPAVHEGITAIEAEIARREGAESTAPLPEPGSEG